MDNTKRLFLIDAYALIFRGYYAFIKNPRINSKGLDTSAILGFTNSLFDVIKREKPEYIAVCFDKGGSQDRIKIFPEYKANRDETPEAIKIAVPYIQEILNALGICIMVKEGYEADDIIGTLAKKAEKEKKLKLPDGRVGSSVKEKKIKDAIAQEKLQRKAKHNAQTAAEADDMAALLARLDQRTAETNKVRRRR